MVCKLSLSVIRLERRRVERRFAEEALLQVLERADREVVPWALQPSHLQATGAISVHSQKIHG